MDPAASSKTSPDQGGLTSSVYQTLPEIQETVTSDTASEADEGTGNDLSKLPITSVPESDACTAAVNSELDSIADARNDTTRTRPGQESEVPRWFIEHCTKTAEELLVHRNLFVREAELSDQASDADTQAQKEAYHIDYAVYSQLERLLSSKSPRSLDESVLDIQNAPFFACDAALLRFRHRTDIGRTNIKFISAIVENFAMEAGADLITLEHGDIEDLAEHYLRDDDDAADGIESREYPYAYKSFGPPQSDHWQHILDEEDVGVDGKSEGEDDSEGGDSDSVYFDTEENMEKFIAVGTEDTQDQIAHEHSDDNRRPDDKLDDGETEAPNNVSVARLSSDVEEAIVGDAGKETCSIALPSLNGPQLLSDGASDQDDEQPQFNFGALLLSTQRKKSITKDAPEEASTPLVIHIREVHRFKDLCSMKFFEELREAINHVTHSVLVLLSVAECTCCESCDEEVLFALSSRPGSRVLEIAPTASEAQRKKNKEDKKSTDWFEKENIRRMQRFVRRSSAELFELPLLQPSADWEFCEGSKIHSRLKKYLMAADLFLELIREINRSTEEQHIKQCILYLGDRTDALFDWSFTEIDAPPAKWSGLSRDAQKAVKTIEGSQRGMEWEQKMLSTLINPDDIEEDWSQIQLEPNVKKAVLQLINQPSLTGRQTRGLLNRHRIGGVLLYGPPGTGKSLLARIIARESKASLFCATAADIEGRLVGDTENAIKALFNIARLLSPSIIFIDEADSMFRGRGSYEWGHERSRVNQLLTEMDGFRKSEKAPFVILASNFPTDLDHAALRRVPSRLYIGLPDTGARLRIMENILRDEELGPNVDLLRIAEKTEGYSGSDVQTLCVQTALVRDDESSTTEAFVQEHFEKALQESAPTISREYFTHIRKFAEQFDSKSLDRLPQGGAVRGTRAFNNGIRESNAALTRDRVESSDAASWSYAIHKENNCAIHDSHHMPDLGPLRTYFAAHRPASIIQRITRKDIPLAISMPDPKEEPFQYAPLDAPSRQIRVLAVLPQVATPHPGSVGADGDRNILRCEMKTVDLNDFTSPYRAISWSHPSARYRLAQWFLASECRHRLARRHNANIDSVINELSRHTDIDLDIPLDRQEAIDHRFNWGDYLALSYVWGDPTHKRDMILNGNRFSVTSNLYDALIQLRSSFEVRDLDLHVWVDAICINQDDLEERGAQVKNMTRIFSEAMTVRGWLGTPSSEVSAELPIVREFLDVNQHMPEDQMQAALVSDQVVAHALWTVLVSLFSESFWTRLWILQEMFVPASLLFWYGSHYFSTRELTKLHHLFRDGGLGKKLSYGLGTTAGLSVVDEALCRLRSLRTSQGTSPALGDMSHLIDLAIRSKASDHRDKVYGVLSMLPEPISDKIRPNYDPSITANEVFTKFSAVWYQQRGMSIRARFRQTPCDCQPSDLPTWALDLGKSCHTWLLASHDHHFHTNQDLPACKLKVSDNNRLLSCEGVITHTVAVLNTKERPTNGEARSLEVATKVAPSRADTNWRRTLARVLQRNPYFDFCQCHPSIFDIPWLSDLDEDYSSHWSTHTNMRWSDKDNYLYEDSKAWPQFSRLTSVGSVFNSVFLPNQKFDVGGKPLRDYFANTDPICSDPKTFINIAQLIINGMDGQVLFQTHDGLLGSAPYAAKLGDKIVVTSACDMPLLLRPKDDAYELVGSCYIEGLMKGEAAREVERGRLRLETIRLV